MQVSHVCPTQLLNQAIELTLLTSSLVILVFFLLAFLILRSHGCLLISLLVMTLSSGMPELQSEESNINRIKYIIILTDILG